MNKKRQDCENVLSFFVFWFILDVSLNMHREKLIVFEERGKEYEQKVKCISPRA